MVVPEDLNDSNLSTIFTELGTTETDDFSLN